MAVLKFRPMSSFEGAENTEVDIEVAESTTVVDGSTKVAMDDVSDEGEAESETTEATEEEQKPVAEGSTTEVEEPDIFDAVAEYRAKEEPSYHAQVENAKNIFTEISLEVANIEAQLKILKADQKAALKKMKALIERGAAATVAPAATSATQLEESATVGVGVDATEAESTAWRDVPVSSLPGLSGSLVEKLAENGIDTLGELEDLRAEIANGKAKWPKGIGEAKITAIENAVIEWLSENQSVVTGETTGGVGAAVEALKVSEALEDSATDAVTAADSSIIARADELNTGEPDALLPPTDSALLELFDLGKSAYCEGRELDSCLYPESEQRDAWIRGWLAMQAEKMQLADL